MSDWDAVPASLLDRDLRDELHLTTELIVAVNEAGSGLSMEEVDQILGVPGRRDPAA